jgi:hypothetical protein
MKRLNEFNNSKLKKEKNSGNNNSKKFFYFLKNFLFFLSCLIEIKFKYDILLKFTNSR